MKKIKIGIICPSEIAFRRFLPALKKFEEFEYAGVAYPTYKDWDDSSRINIESEKKKAQAFFDKYGGQIYEGYEEIVTSQNIDAIYLPLPPALHYKWAKLALENNKHVFLEKPSTICLSETEELINLATSKKLALHENYMFIYHNQIKVLQQLIEDKVVGDIRLIRSCFGFPKRSESDFRYNKKLGGGALLDCGGYPLKLISLLLGHDVKIDSSNLIYNKNNVDLYGAVQLSNKKHVAQIAFGMDNAYKCDIEIWGSLGTIFTGRIFTAPDMFETDIYINKDNQTEKIHINGDDAFYKSIKYFQQCITDEYSRENSYKNIFFQSQLVDHVMKGTILK